MFVSTFIYGSLDVNDFLEKSISGIWERILFP